VAVVAASVPAADRAAEATPGQERVGAEELIAVEVCGTRGSRPVAVVRAASAQVVVALAAVERARVVAGPEVDGELGAAEVQALGMVRVVAAALAPEAAEVGQGRGVASVVRAKAEEVEVVAALVLVV
jgi:hypothetical protein